MIKGAQLLIEPNMQSPPINSYQRCWVLCLYILTNNRSTGTAGVVGGLVKMGLRGVCGWVSGRGSGFGMVRMLWEKGGVDGSGKSRMDGCAGGGKRKVVRVGGLLRDIGRRPLDFRSG